MRIRVRDESVTRRSMRGFDNEALAAARTAKGWTPARLAREAGVGVSTLRHWEKGRRSPEPDNLARVIAALGVPIEAVVRPRAGRHTLADRRVLAGLTQPQLGARTGISTTSISALERAEISLSDDRAQRLSAVLGISVDEVVDAYEAARVRGDDIP